jgi:hypothetical protein
MTAQPAALHTDTNARETSSSYADRGDGTNDWHIYVKVRDAAAAGILKLEDAPHVSGDAGVMALAVRQDTLAALAGTTGDYIPLTTDAFGRLRIVGSHLEDAPHVSGDAGVMALAVRQDTLAALAGTDGDYSPLSVDSLGRLRIVGSHLEDAPHVSGDAGVMALAVRQDTLAALAGTTGDYIPLTTDAFGRLSTVARPSSSDTAGWTRVASAGALATSLVVKASAGRLRLVRVTSTLGAVQYLQLHNATSLPANGATPAHVVAIPANSSAELDLGELGDYFATGIVAAVSTTAATLTVGAADSVFSALFV